MFCCIFLVIHKGGKTTNQIFCVLSHIVKIDAHMYLLLEHVEVVDDDTNEEIQREEGPNNDEDDKEQVRNKGVFSPRLFIHLKQTVKMY